MTLTCLFQIEDALAPAEQGIVGIPELLDEMRPLLDSLKTDVPTGKTLANDAQKQANLAQDEADHAAEVLKHTQHSHIIISRGFFSKLTPIYRIWRT